MSRDGKSACDKVGPASAKTPTQLSGDAEAGPPKRPPGRPPRPAIAEMPLDPAYQKLDPTIMMMQFAEDRPSNELAEPLDRPTTRRILAQVQMRSQFVVIAGVGCKHPVRMGLAEDNDVIKAFPADRADQSLRMAILPRGARGRWVISAAHRHKALCNHRSVASVAVSNVLGDRRPRSRASTVHHGCGAHPKADWPSSSLESGAGSPSELLAGRRERATSSASK